jgi:tRNA (guanine-N7-)-methyltransferase
MKFKNVALEPNRINQLYFAEDEVDEIWITFPDPQIKYKRTKHRMTNSEFYNCTKYLKKTVLLILKRTVSSCMDIRLFTSWEGHEVLYANHNVYVNEGSGGSD